MKRTALTLALAALVAATLAPASMASVDAPDAPSPARTRSSGGDAVRGPGALGRGFDGPRNVGGNSAPAAVPGEIVVTYRDGASRTARAEVAAGIEARVVDRVPGMNAQTLRVPAGEVEAAVRELRGTPGVLTADPNFILTPASIPNDPQFPNQWGLRNVGQNHFISDPPPNQTASGLAGRDIDADVAWDTQKGAAGSVIAVIDTGVDTDHPDLVNRLVPQAKWRNTSGDGLPTNPNPNPTEQGYSHGTHVAGIIAAQQDNNLGGSGVCPNCRIMPIRFGFSLSSEVAAIDWAIKEGADVINASYGGAPWNKTERNAIKKAGKNGILFVVAAGNDSLDNDTITFQGTKWLAPSFPASYELPTILSVAATNHKDEYGYWTGCAEEDDETRATCSMTSFGRVSVDVGAPGIDIFSTVVVGNGHYGPSPANGYDVWNGTSMATPMVAGVAGLVKAEHPNYSPAQLKNAIMNSVDKPASLNKYVRITTCGNCKLVTGKFTRTNGRVNADAALDAPTKNATKKDDGSIAGAKPIAKTKSGAVKWPTDTNDVYKKSLKKGKFYKITVKTKSKRVDVLVWNPTTRDLNQMTLGCLVSGGGPCPMVGSKVVGANKKWTGTFKATKAGVHYFQMHSFYLPANAPYTLTVKPA